MLDEYEKDEQVLRSIGFGMYLTRDLKVEERLELSIS